MLQPEDDPPEGIGDESMTLGLILNAYETMVGRGAAEEDAAERAPSVVVGMLPTMAKSVAANAHRSSDELFERVTHERAEIAGLVADRWGRAFNICEMVVAAAAEFGFRAYEIWCKEYDEENPVDSGESTANLISVLHGRACTTAEEVLCLMRAGLADGAAARQRTLHELAVIMTLLDEYDHLDLAERYIAYSIVEQYEDMTSYQRHASQLAVTPFSDEEVAELEAEYNAVLAEYGPRFRRRNQWAAPLFPPNTDVTFVLLEEKAGLGHLRPYYRFSNHHIHAGARAAILNVREAGDHLEIGVGARSDVNIAETGHGAMISLYQCTVRLLNIAELIHADPDNLLMVMSIDELVRNSGVAFERAARRL